MPSLLAGHAGLAVRRKAHLQNVSIRLLPMPACLASDLRSHRRRQAHTSIDGAFVCAGGLNLDEPTQQIKRLLLPESSRLRQIRHRESRDLAFFRSLHAILMLLAG